MSEQESLSLDFVASDALSGFIMRGCFHVVAPRRIELLFGD